MGNNLSKEGLDNILKQEFKRKIKEPTAKEIQNDWHKLRSAISGMK